MPLEKVDSGEMAPVCRLTVSPEFRSLSRCSSGVSAAASPLAARLKATLLLRSESSPTSSSITCTVTLTDTCMIVKKIPGLPRASPRDEYFNTYVQPNSEWVLPYDLLEGVSLRIGDQFTWGYQLKNEGPTGVVMGAPKGMLEMEDFVDTLTELHEAHCRRGEHEKGEATKAPFDSSTSLNPVKSCRLRREIVYVRRGLPTNKLSKMRL